MQGNVEARSVRNNVGNGLSHQVDKADGAHVFSLDGDGSGSGIGVERNGTFLLDRVNAEEGELVGIAAAGAATRDGIMASLFRADGYTGGTVASAPHVGIGTSGFEEDTTTHCGLAENLDMHIGLRNHIEGEINIVSGVGEGEVAGLLGRHHFIGKRVISVLTDGVDKEGGRGAGKGKLDVVHPSAIATIGAGDVLVVGEGEDVGTRINGESGARPYNITRGGQELGTIHKETEEIVSLFG